MNTDAGQSGEIRLLVPARAESLALIRQAAAGAAEAIGMTDRRTADLQLLATEASTNVVRHAGGHRSAAEFELEIGPTNGFALLVVRDHGGGFTPTPRDDTYSSLGLGIPIMASLSRSLELRSIEGDGVEVRAEIPVSDTGSGEPEPYEWEGLPSGVSARVKTRSGWPLRSVLTHLIGHCAARVGLSTAESADALIVTDAVASASTGDEETEVTLSEQEGSAELRIGPLPEAAGPALIEALEVAGAGSRTGEGTAVSVTLSDGPGNHLTLALGRASKMTDRPTGRGVAPFG